MPSRCTLRYRAIYAAPRCRRGRMDATVAGAAAPPAEALTPEFKRNLRTAASHEKKKLLQGRYAAAVAKAQPVDAIEAAWFELYEEPMVLGSYEAFVDFGRLGDLVGRPPRDDVCLHTLRDDERVSTPPLGPSNVRPTPPPGSAKKSRDFAGRRARATPPRA